MPNTNPASGIITTAPETKKENTQAFGTYASSKGRSRKNGGSRKSHSKKKSRKHRK
jgi:hypothetical protein